MLDNKGFDLWADGYDQSVGLSDEDGTYPFAGYKQILNEIYNRVLTGKGKKCWILVLAQVPLLRNCTSKAAIFGDRIFQKE